MANDRGWGLLEFAKCYRLTLANFSHNHKLSRTATWHAPNGQVHNQIDFILTPQRFKSSINRAVTTSFPGAHNGSVLSTIKLKLKIKCFTRSPSIRFDLEKLKDPKNSGRFHAMVGGKFAALCVLDSDVDTLAKSKRSATLDN